MSFDPPSRRLVLSALLASSLGLAACGGGSSSKDSSSTTVRAINLSDMASADLYTGDTRRFSTLSDAPAPPIRFDGAAYTLNVKKAGEAATLLSDPATFLKDKHYTVVIWGRESGLRLVTLAEDENSNDIAAGSARLRIFNATGDSGALDVFLTAPTTVLGDTAPTQGALTSGMLSGFRNVTKGTYRLRLTGAAEPNDVRLDIPAITLGEKEFSTLVITAGASGVLVNGTVIVQQGAVTQTRNTKARVRMVASMDSGGIVAATLGSTTLTGSLRSPSVGPYTLFDAGNLAPTVRVNGVIIPSSPQSFVAGTDYTLLTYGAVGAGKLEVFSDDNRLPTSATRTKVRLVNGVQGADPLTLAVDFLPLAVDVAAGKASDYVTTNSKAAVLVEVSSAAAAAPLYRIADVNLQAQAVYTVFTLGGNAVPTGMIRKER